MQFDWEACATQDSTATARAGRIARMFARALPASCSLFLFFLGSWPELHARPAQATRETEAVFHPDKLAEIDALIALAIQDGRCPGGVLWVERQGAIYRKAFGERALEPQREPMTEETIFDAASLTKVTATTSAILKLVEQRKIELDLPVSHYLVEFGGAGKESITVRQLLTHTSGLRAGLPATPAWSGNERAVELACAEPLPDPPGSTMRYSDVNFIVLGELVRRVSGEALDTFCATHFFAPLGMRDTMYRPPETRRSRIAPTTRDVERGVVHDPTARRMGGVAGHAGLFTTVADLARFARMMLGEGELDGVRVFQAATVKLMTGVHTPEEIPARRGLGWDVDSSYSGPRGRWFPRGSYGHTGWTGGSLWIDPFSKTFVIFLSNRNHPTEAGSVIALRHAIGTLASEAVRDFNFLHVPGALAQKPGATWSLSAPREATAAEVLTGIDVLARAGFKALHGLKIGLITNQTGIDRRRRSTIDLLHKAPGVELVALFSPEHGIRGILDQKVADSQDEKTGLPIHSLYGETRAPTAEQLAGVDALVFDIQDIGCRFYTYISTLGECLGAAARAGKKVFVLDRPNPIGGAVIEGPMLAGETSFTAWHDLPVRHGMTVGELARMFNEERRLGADLTIVACEGWSRRAWFDETGLPWVNPSPNMRSLTAAVLYPGIGLVEFCPVSVGRGTDRPFELVGAPYMDDRQLAAELNAAALPAVRFIPVRFTPAQSVFKGEECRGVQILVTNRDHVNAVDVGLTLARTLHLLYPREFKIERMQKLLVHPPTLEGIQSAKSLAAIKASWLAERQGFRERRDRVLLYR